MSTYAQFVAIVRVPSRPVPPAALKGLAATSSLPAAIESQSASLPAVESSTLPLDASGLPAWIVSMKLVASARSVFCCVDRSTRCSTGSPVKSPCVHSSRPQKQT
eukprot:7289867-Prymnesium_polylepis.1